MTPQAIIPYVIESGPRGERSYDIYSRLLKDRIVLLGTEVVDEIANAIVAQLLFLEVDDDEKPINFYINSPGGSVTAGLAIYDAMQLVKPQVHTTVIGQACSMGSFLLAAGEPGHRTALPNARVMIHKLAGGVQGSIGDIKPNYREMERLDEVLTQLFAEKVGKPVEQVSKDMDRDNWMNAVEAKTYGIVDTIYSPATRKKAKR